MKKVFMTLAAVAAFSFANAQFFVGGSLGFSSESGNKKETWTSTYLGTTTTTTSEEKTPSYSEFSFSPKVGYYLNDKLAVGIELGFTTYSETEYLYDDDAEIHPGSGPNKAEQTEYNYKSTENLFGVAPFVRYHFAQWNNFSLFGELSVGLAFGSSKEVATINGKEEEMEGPSLFGFGVSIVPGISYKINDHIQLEATLDVFGLNYIYSKSTQNQEYNYSNYNATLEGVITASKFGFGLDTQNLFSVANLTIGFVYRF